MAVRNINKKAFQWQSNENYRHKFKRNFEKCLNHFEAKIMDFVGIDSSKVPRCKVELHVHLDGSVRITTIWELALKKGHNLKLKTQDDLYNACAIKTPSTLENFLKPFSIFLPLIVGDAEAIERIAYEFCEDSVKQGVLYSEVRYCPHLLSTTHSDIKGIGLSGPLTPREVVMSVNRGLSRGSADFGLTVRSILCCFHGHPEWSTEIADLCIEFHRQGVVGIDIAGDESLGVASPDDIDAFRKAESAGIHRTAHAGEAGPAGNVHIAISQLNAERIGHGYHILESQPLYSMCRFTGIHFETCPYSSCLTGSVPKQDIQRHPIVRFAEDKVNFSISRDDPTITQKTLDQEYEFLRSHGLKEVHIVRANYNAARSSFLPEEEKRQLLSQLSHIYGADYNLNEAEDRHPILPKAMSGAGDC